MQKTISARQLKAQCFQLMKEVQEKQVTLVITQHDIPIAKLVPVKENPISLYGALQDTVIIKGDITAPVEESWDAES